MGLVMDDESAGSEATKVAVNELKGEGFNIYLHFRRRSEGRGLGSAVLNGFRAAKNSVIVCMDADLQHEPEAVPGLVQPIHDGIAQFTMGSRNVTGGGVGFQWSRKRVIMSWGATTLARGLTNTTDPMSGFFATKRSL